MSISFCLERFASFAYTHTRWILSHAMLTQHTHTQTRRHDVTTETNSVLSFRQPELEGLERSAVADNDYTSVNHNSPLLLLPPSPSHSYSFLSLYTSAVLVFVLCKRNNLFHYKECKHTHARIVWFAQLLAYYFCRTKEGNNSFHTIYCYSLLLSYIQSYFCIYINVSKVYDNFQTTINVLWM